MVPGILQTARGLQNVFEAQNPGTPAPGDESFAAQIHCSLHGIFRGKVPVALKPGRDRHHANIHLSIAPADIFKQIAVSGIPCKIHPIALPLEQPATPEVLIPFIQRPPRTRIGGKKGDAVLFLPNYFQFDLQFYFHFTSDPNLVLEFKAGFVYLKSRRYWSAEGCF